MIPADRDGWLVRQLPVGMIDDDFFVRFVTIFQDVADTYLETLDSIPSSLDLSVAPAPFVRWLGTWIGIDAVDPGLDVATQRAWVRGYGSVLARRGTKAGIEAFLALICAGDITVEEGGGVYREDAAPQANPAWVRISVERLADVSEFDFVRLIRDEVPAHVSLEVTVGGRVVIPAGVVAA